MSQSEHVIFQPNHFANVFVTHQLVSHLNPLLEKEITFLANLNFILDATDQSQVFNSFIHLFIHL